MASRPANELPSPVLWAALSGGLDSIVLLHYLKFYAASFLSASKFSRLNAVHINHQLLPEAQNFEQLCRDFCFEHAIDLTVIPVTISRLPGESLEAKARDARYAEFQKLLDNQDILVTAHHEDDQAETVLLQLLRGAGLRGVASMPGTCPFGKGYLMRPLLTVSRETLAAYAAYHHLNFINDPSNQSLNFDRNYLRHNIFPLLKKRWPKTSQTFSRFSRHCAEQEKVLSEFAQKDWNDCKGDFLHILNLDKLKNYSASRQKNILRFFIEKNGCSFPPETILNQLLSFLTIKKDKIPCVKWAGIKYTRYQNYLYLITANTNKNAVLFNLSPGQYNWCKQNLPSEIYHYIIQHHFNKGFDQDYNLDQTNSTLYPELNIAPHLISYSSPVHHAHTITLAYRKGGEKFKPKNNLHTRTLKSLFQNWKVPPWERGEIPLIYLQDRLIAVIGYAVIDFEKDNL